MDVDAELAKAVHFHESGDLLAAGEIYREILAVDPEHVDALNLLGVVMHAAGDLELAIELTGRAAELAPDYFAPLVNLGNALQAAGRAAEAVEKFEAARRLNPDDAIVVNNLASALNEIGQADRAFEAASRAIELAAAFPDAHVNLGNALLTMGRAADAAVSYTSALELDPRHDGAWFNLGNAHVDAGDHRAAEMPYRKAVEFRPEEPERHYNLGNTLQQLDRYEEAEASFLQAISLHAGYTDARCNLASALQSMGRTAEAVETLRAALIDEPDSVDLHWNLSLALLQDGEMENGWREYEWRWRTPTFADFRRDFPEPAWRGEPFDGRTLLVHAEQGFGDALQFVRYLPMAAARGGRVILECRPELRTLFDVLDGIDGCVSLGDSLPSFDLHIPLMSLPHVFETTLETVPAEVPYLRPPGAAQFAAKEDEGAAFDVGIVWSGSPTRPDNHKRSCPLSEWTAILGVSGVRFHALQLGAARDQLKTLDDGNVLVDRAGELNDFAHTAAVIDTLDLVISVDTAVLHLAGALAKPAFALLSQPTGFLWMNDRPDSPWYPTLRLFRQPEPGAWTPVIAAAAEALARLAGNST